VNLAQPGGAGDDNKEPEMARRMKKHRGRKRGSKARAQKIHFLRRVAGRTGATLTKDDYERIVRDIQLGRARMVYKQSNRIIHYRVQIGDQERIVVFDNSRKTLVTVIPEKDEII